MFNTLISVALFFLFIVLPVLALSRQPVIVEQIALPRVRVARSPFISNSNLKRSEVLATIASLQKG